jgi:hypothetical protein
MGCDRVFLKELNNASRIAEKLLLLIDSTENVS